MEMIKMKGFDQPFHGQFDRKGRKITRSHIQLQDAKTPRKSILIQLIPTFLPWSLGGLELALVFLYQELRKIHD